MEPDRAIEALDQHVRAVVEADPLAALSEIVAARAVLAERERDAVRAALGAHSWREIGQALGVSKQAVFQRFGKEWAVGLRASLNRKEWHAEIRRQLRD
jgi:hypothetical protein